MMKTAKGVVSETDKARHVTVVIDQIEKVKKSVGVEK